MDIFLNFPAISSSECFYISIIENCIFRSKNFFAMIIFSFVVWHDSDSCAIITFIDFWNDSPNRLYTLWRQGKCLMFNLELILERHGFGLHESIYPWISSVISVTVPHNLQLIEFMGPIPQIWRKSLYGGQTISYIQLCGGWALLISMLFEADLFPSEPNTLHTLSTT